ncbi:hypothetical protein [Streptomyces sp. NPDC093094]|uniref:hypothetical protein n=1 Tax=Streptomyces sp. NPDC093094 TaxID=3366026 RepID=UPI003811ADB4
MTGVFMRELGMPQAEAAQVMGAATATVGVHAHRAIKALRVALVGVGMALVSWATGSIAMGEREIVPASGAESTPAVYAVTMSLLIMIGLVSVMLGWALIRPGWFRLSLWDLLFPGGFADPGALGARPGQRQRDNARFSRRHYGSRPHGRVP